MDRTHTCNCVLHQVNYRASKNWFNPPRSFTTDQSKAVLLLRFLFVFMSMVSYVAFVLSLLVSFLPYLGASKKAVLRDCGIFKVYLLMFYIHLIVFQSVFINYTTFVIFFFRLVYRTFL